MKKYFKVWKQIAIMNLESQYGSGSRLNTALLIAGKIIRLFFVLAFLIYLFAHTKTLAGYTLYQTLLFFMTFNLVDITAQFFFRGIYVTRNLVKEGYLDTVLVKPINPLFRIASHTIDFLDLLTLIPVVGVLIYVISNVGPLTYQSVSVYLFLCFLGFLIAMAIHIIIAALAVSTQEIDNEIWIYRDLMTMGRFPVDIYSAPIQFILTFVVPVAVMISIPSKALIGNLAFEWIFTSTTITFVFVTFSLWFWNYCLKQYSSISN
nr:ABC-2 family transporter protein [Candidatus Levybacteria bacterium]